LPACTEVLSARLAEASPEVRSEWLSYFASHCGGGCDQAYQCFAQSPTCTPSGVSCSRPLECCNQESQGVPACPLLSEAPTCL